MRVYYSAAVVPATIAASDMLNSEETKKKPNEEIQTKLNEVIR